TKKAPPAPPATSCFASFYSWLDSTAADCPLSYMGVTVYGTIDVGLGYNSHGVAFNSVYPTGIEELISKNSQGAKYTLVPNGISQSNVGVKISEPLGSSGFSFVGNAQLGFDPYSLRLANGPQAMAENTQLPLPLQNGNGDSSRAGQWDNSFGYLGVSSKTFGTLTVGREYALTLDGVNAYDPMGGSYAFSPIGYSGKTAGTGSTEDARPNTAVKYNVTFNNFRLGALWQFGGYEQGNASNGEYQIDVGADFYNFAVDAIYTYVKDQVNLATYNGPLPVGAPSDALKATLSDNDSVMLLAKYTNGPVKLFGGYEYIRYMNPSDTYPGGLTSIGGYPVLGSGVTSTAFVNNEIFQIFWTGAKYSILSNLDVAGAYYYYNQNNYSLAGTNCGPNTTAPAPGYAPQGAANSKCAGTMDAFSALIDWKPVKRLDVYAGLMYSEMHGGLANGYLHSNDIDPTIGLRLQF
ncbi:MAG TPA: porin, partial [Roseiarcus sp.]|nr:porin [Roseiarcus sp.]